MGYNRQQNTMKKGMILVLMAAALVMGGQAQAQKGKVVENFVRGKGISRTIKPITPSIPHVSTTLTPYRGVRTTTNFAHPTLPSTAPLFPICLPDSSAHSPSAKIRAYEATMSRSNELLRINAELFKASEEQPPQSPLMPRAKRPKNAMGGAFGSPEVVKDTSSVE